MIDIRFGYLFFWTFRLVAFIGVFASFLIVSSSLAGAIILFLGCVFVITATEGTEVDTVKKVYREYNSFFFIKSGKLVRLPEVESVFITQGKEKQNMSTMRSNHSASYENVVYNGYLKFSSGEKIQLLRDKNKNRVLEKIDPLAKGLKTEIIDYTS